MKTLLPNQGFIINTAKSTEPGEHWVLIWQPANTICEYFDSYGLAPFKSEILNFLPRKFKYNNTRLQSLMSSCCGQYCLYVFIRDI